MGFLNWLSGSNDHHLANSHYTGQESATDRAARKRREQHHARIARDGDNAGTKIPRSLRRKAT